MSNVHYLDNDKASLLNALDKIREYIENGEVTDLALVAIGEDTELCYVKPNEDINGLISNLCVLNMALADLKYQAASIASMAPFTEDTEEDENDDDDT